MENMYQVSLKALPHDLQNGHSHLARLTVNSKLKYNFFTSHKTTVSTVGRKNIKIPMLHDTNVRNQIKCKNCKVVTLIIHR